MPGSLCISLTLFPQPLGVWENPSPTTPPHHSVVWGELCFVTRWLQLIVSLCDNTFKAGSKNRSKCKKIFLKRKMGWFGSCRCAIILSSKVERLYLFLETRVDMFQNGSLAHLSNQHEFHLMPSLSSGLSLFSPHVSLSPVSFVCHFVSPFLFPNYLTVILSDSVNIWISQFVGL